LIDKKGQPVLNQAKATVFKSRQQALWHVVVLNILTICGYSVIWFWKNWRQLHDFSKKQYEQIPDHESTIKGSPAVWKYFRNMKPWVHGFFVTVPYIQYYFFYLGFKQFAEVSPQCKISYYLMGLILTVCFVGVLPYASHLDLTALLALLSTFPLVYSQHLLNGFWKSVEPPEARPRQMFAIEEWLFVVLGFFIAIAYVLLLIVGPIIMKFLEQGITIKM
jgi:hypothetical protein